MDFQPDMFNEKTSEVESTLDELFKRSVDFRESSKYFEFMQFITKLRKYSVFNNALVFLQNPKTTYYATAVNWSRGFHRRIKEDARPMVILAPMTPVLLVYDYVDTIGPELPKHFFEPITAYGELDLKIFELTLENLKKEGILVIEKPQSPNSAGTVTRSCYPSPIEPYRFSIEINKNHSTNTKYATLCHEMAHIYLGHLGGDEFNNWPDRPGLSKEIKELEAESVSFLVCKRLGIRSNSEEYLADYVWGANIKEVSIDAVIRAAAYIEKIGRKKTKKKYDYQDRMPIQVIRE